MRPACHCLPSVGEVAAARNGRLFGLRSVRAEDEAEILSFLSRFSTRSRCLRFFSAGCNLQFAAHWAASADGTDHCGLVVTDDNGEIVGHAAYVRFGTDAEVAVEVADSLHHLGLGTVLIARLARIAESQGIERFVALVLPENHEMLTVFHDGFRTEDERDSEVIHVTFATADWRDVSERLEAAPLVD